MSLSSLLERVEACQGPDREIDRAIWKACGIDYRQSVTQPVTASVDAALALIGRVLPGWTWDAGSESNLNGTFYTAILWTPDAKRDSGEQVAKTPALALCAALLAAMIGEEAKPSPPSTVTP